MRPKSDMVCVIYLSVITQRNCLHINATQASPTCKLPTVPSAVPMVSDTDNGFLIEPVSTTPQYLLHEAVPLTRTCVGKRIAPVLVLPASPSRWRLEPAVRLLGSSARSAFVAFQRISAGRMTSFQTIRAWSRGGRRSSSRSGRRTAHPPTRKRPCRAGGQA